MGTDVLVVVVGGDTAELAARARARLHDLEQRWSRFRVDSEVSAVNASAGAPVLVSTVTAEVVAAAIEGWRLTGGRFDPTLLRPLEQAGYDRSFELLDAAGPPSGPATAPLWSDHWSDQGAGGWSDAWSGRWSHGEAGGAATLGVHVDERAGTVTIEDGLGLDLGGIGKGRAADLAVADLLHAGAEGVCVDIGGDVRVAGRAPDDGDWVVGVADPSSDNDIATTAVALADGAVATSTRCRRRWLVDGRPVHHLIDPATGRPADGDLDTVTVIAGDAWWAEVVAKAALIGGSVDGAELIASSGMSGLLRHADGGTVRVGAVASFEVAGPALETAGPDADGPVRSGAPSGSPGPSSVGR